MKYICLLTFLLSHIPLSRLNSQVVDSTFGEPYSFLGMPDFVPGATACDFDSRSDRSYSILFLDDGKIILAGHTSGYDSCDFAFARLLPDGKFDQSAGPDGQVRLDLGHQNDSCLAAVRYQADYILMGGCVTLSGQAGYASLLVRTDFDGNLDAGFGDQGQVIIDLQGTREMITKILPLPDGKIIIAGNTYYGPSYQYPDSTLIFIGRLLPDGQVDNSFGTNGFLYQRFNTCNSTLLGDLKLGNDGYMVVTGGGYHPYPGIYEGEGIWCSHSIHLCRYSPDGQPDPDFGINGVVALPVTAGRGNALFIYGDGRIVVAGLTSDFLIDPVYTLVARLFSDGTRDSTFNEDGYFRQFLHGFLGDGSEPVDITLLNDELIVGFIDSPLGPNLTFGVFCLTTNGELNPNFGENGIFSYSNSYPLTGYSVSEIRLSADQQRLYFGGMYNKLTHSNMMICRLDISGKNPTMTDEKVGAGSVNIYPNPARGNVFYLDPSGLMDLEDLHLRIWDIAGRTVIVQGLHAASFQEGIDVSRLVDGVYFLELLSQNERQFGKLLIQR